MVIGIIGVLSTLATVTLVRARNLARETKAKGDLRQFRTALLMLENDTGKWPNGCPPLSVVNPEVDLHTAQAGLEAKPSVGNQGDGCTWIQEDLDKWKGPYITSAGDPWGSHYWFDPDFVPYQNCASQTVQPQTVVILSFGPNKQQVNGYDCDDLFVNLKQ